MRRIVAAIVLPLGVLAGLLLLARGQAPYASLRVTRTQEVPGTLGWVLEPPHQDAEPQLSPDRAAAITRASGGAPDAEVGLALVRDRLAAGGAFGPAWVVVSHGVCIRASKGELVSDARGADPSDLGCTEESLVVDVLDADTGERLLVLSGYDPGGRWSPAVDR